MPFNNPSKLVSELSPSSVDDIPPKPMFPNPVLEARELFPVESLSSLSILAGLLRFVLLKGARGGGGGCGGSLLPFVAV